MKDRIIEALKNIDDNDKFLENIGNMLIQYAKKKEELKGKN